MAEKDRLRSTPGTITQAEVNNYPEPNSPGLIQAYLVQTRSPDGSDNGFHTNDLPEETELNKLPHIVGGTIEDTPSAVESGSAAILADGMLLRDIPKRTTMYDSVADRQMSQTEAKLFYQRSQGGWAKPAGSLRGSPIVAARADHHSPSGERDRERDNQEGSTDICNIDRMAPTSATGSIILPPPELGLEEVEENVGPQDSSEAATITGNIFNDDCATEDPVSPFGTDRLDTATFTAPGPVQPMAGFGSETHVTTELSAIARSIKKILDKRQKYMQLSLQAPGCNPKDNPDWPIYPPPPEPAWVATCGDSKAFNPEKPIGSVSTPAVGSDLTPAMGSDISNRALYTKAQKPAQCDDVDFHMQDLLPLPHPSDELFKLDSSGIYQVFEDIDQEQKECPIVKVPTLRDFYMDLDDIVNISSDGPSKSFAFRRLQYLEGKFNLYSLLNEYQETADTKKVPHRDFYNVRKVDTHVHHSACMNQKHLLRFIKSKMKKFPNEVVLFRDGRHLTLSEVFSSIDLTAYDLSIDTLDMHAHKDSFHRFDKFNLKYNPIGESRLRTIFLKTDNFINGRYLAEITKEVISDLESSKYQMVEWRISVYGRSIDEWDKLAAWVVDNKLFSHNVRWLVQIPRLYDVYKATDMVENFEQIIRNIFEPLFEVTQDPSSHPKLHVFLQRVIGFDSVDDESKVERRLFKKFPVPREWNTKQTPPYSYWIYHLYANMISLNSWRQRRGFNTFLLRPHCGEAGDSEHLAVAALCCHSISHGLLLRKVPLLQYIFYLDQIGIAMSPLSNNALFLAYERNPFHQYFKRGLNVSLSTDDPLQFAFTKEPLIEEYAVAAQIYKLSPVDMCELAKNSVLQSGYELSIKRLWLGPNCHLSGREGNTMVKTNVPDRREEFRHGTLVEEREMLNRYMSFELSSSPFQPDEQANQTTRAATPTSENCTANVSENNAWPTENMAGLHLSGSDPKIFPGILRP
jgi:AMP deaminase